MGLTWRTVLTALPGVCLLKIMLGCGLSVMRTGAHLPEPSRGRTSPLLGGGGLRSGEGRGSEMRDVPPNQALLPLVF